MRHLGVILGLVAVLVAAASGEDKEKSDKDKLQGDWALVSSETGDRGKKDEKEVKRLRLRVKDDAWQLLRDDKPTSESVVVTFKLNSTKSPKEVDLELKSRLVEKAQRSKGIYEIDGDTLTVCRTLAVDMERPTEFKATKGVLLEVYQRVEKK